MPYFRKEQTKLVLYTVQEKKIEAGSFNCVYTPPDSVILSGPVTGTGTWCRPSYCSRIMLKTAYLWILFVPVASTHLRGG